MKRAKPAAVLDPTVRRGVGLRPEDRLNLVLDCEHLVEGVESNLKELRRLPVQLFDMESPDRLVDAATAVVVQADILLAETLAQRKALATACRKLKAALQTELRRSPDDEP